MGKEATPVRATASDEEAIPERETTSDEEITPEREATSDEEVTPERETTSDEKAALERDTTSDEDAASGRETTMDEEAAPERESTSDEDVTPERETTMDEEVTPERETTMDEEFTPKTTSDEVATPERETTMDEEATAERESTSDEEATLQRETTSDEEATPDRETTMDEDVTPERETSMDEEFTPERKTTSDEVATPERETTSNEQVTPEREATSDEEATLERETTSDEEVTQEIETTMDEKVTPEGETASDEEATLERETTSGEEATPGRETTSDEEATPERETTMDEDVTPERETTSDEEATPERETTPDDEATLERETTLDEQAVLSEVTLGLESMSEIDFTSDTSRLVESSDELNAGVNDQARALVQDVIKVALVNLDEQEDFTPCLIKTDDGDRVMVKIEDGTLEERYELMEFELYEQYMKEKGSFSPFQRDFPCDVDRVFMEECSSIPGELEYVEDDLITSQLSVIMEEPLSSADSSLSGSVIKCKSSHPSEGNLGSDEYVITSPTEFDIVRSSVREIQSGTLETETDEQGSDTPVIEAGDEFMLLWRTSHDAPDWIPRTEAATVKLRNELEDISTSEDIHNSITEDMNYLKLATLLSPEEPSDCLPESSGSSVRSWISSDLSSLDDETTSARISKDRRKGDENEMMSFSLPPFSSVHTVSDKPFSKTVTMSSDGDRTITKVVTIETSTEVVERANNGDEAVSWVSDGSYRGTKRKVTKLVEKEPESKVVSYGPDGSITETRTITEVTTFVEDPSKIILDISDASETRTTREVTMFEEPESTVVLYELDGSKTESRTTTEVTKFEEPRKIILDISDLSETRTPREVTKFEEPKSKVVLYEPDGSITETRTVRKVSKFEEPESTAVLYGPDGSITEARTVREVSKFEEPESKVVLYGPDGSITERVVREGTTVETKTELETIKHDCVVTHNYHRHQHGSPELRWSPLLAIEALNWAEKLLRTGSVQSSETLDRGENIAISGDSNFDVKNAVQSWYNEETFYDYNTPGFSSNTRNFTQMLWKGTKEVGMALSRDQNGVVIVARYSPPGNEVGLFDENIKQRNKQQELN